MAKRKWAAVAILAAYACDSEENDREYCEKIKVARRRRNWTKNWLKNRDRDGYCAKLMVELRAEEPELYRGFVRLTADQFDYLLSLVGPHIEKQDTNMRSSISATNRLALTLRYLATGEVRCSTYFAFRKRQSRASSQKYSMQSTKCS